MLTAATPGEYSATLSSPLPSTLITGTNLLTIPLEFDVHTATSSISGGSNQLGVRRRANFQQGRALEILGHAVEYLVDSRMFLVTKPTTRADSQATEILMRLSREVFSECAEVIPVARRLRLWVANHLLASA